MNKIMEHTTKYATITIIEGILQSLLGSPNEWKVTKNAERGCWDHTDWIINIVHKNKPIQLRYSLGTFLGVYVSCSGENIKRIPLSLRFKLKRVVKKLYRKHRTERRIFRLNKMMSGLKVIK